MNDSMPDLTDFLKTRDMLVDRLFESASVPKSMFATSGTGPASDQVDLIKKLKESMDRFLTPAEVSRTLVVQDAKMLGPTVPNLEGLVGEIKVVECPFLEPGTMYWMNDPIVFNPAFEIMDLEADRAWRYQMQMELSRQSCAVRFKMVPWPKKYRGARRRTRR